LRDRKVLQKIRKRERKKGPLEGNLANPIKEKVDWVSNRNSATEGEENSYGLYYRLPITREEETVEREGFKSGGTIEG